MIVWIYFDMLLFVVLQFRTHYGQKVKVQRKHYTKCGHKGPDMCIDATMDLYIL